MRLKLTRNPCCSLNRASSSLTTRYMVNAPAMFAFGYSIIKQFLHPVTISKIEVLSSGYQQKLQAMMLAPVALVAVLMGAGAISALRDKQREAPLLNAWLHSWLPGVLKLTFAVFPAASRRGPKRVSPVAPAVDPCWPTALDA